MRISTQIHDGFETIANNYGIASANSNGRSAKQHNDDRERLIIIKEALEYIEQNDASDTVLLELIRRQAQLILDLMAGKVLIPRNVRNRLRRKAA
jgi:hypothetical protein